MKYYTYVDQTSFDDMTDAQHTPPGQWNLSPEIKEWLGKITMKIEKEKQL